MRRGRATARGGPRTRQELRRHRMRKPGSPTGGDPLDVRPPRPGRAAGPSRHHATIRVDRRLAGPRARPRPRRRRGCGRSRRRASPAPAPGTQSRNHTPCTRPVTITRTRIAALVVAARLTPGTPRRRTSSGWSSGPGAIGRRQRVHASPSRSYTWWWCWYSPGLPNRSTYCSSASDEPRYFTASCSVSTDRAVEAAHLLLRQRVALALPAEPGLEQDLVAVDVADAGDELLVHQQRLQPRLALGEHAAEQVPRQRGLERVEPEVRELLDLLVDLVVRRRRTSRRTCAGSTKRNSPPCVNVITTCVCFGAFSRAVFARSSCPDMPRCDDQRVGAVEPQHEVLAPPLRRP